VVVELFTAQGCSDCIEANEFLMKLADQPGVIALTYPVDYWDYLGWKDTFAKPEFADRQRTYMRLMKLRDVYTPQIVVDGAHQLAGVKTEEVQALVREAQHDRDPAVAISVLTRGRVHIGSGHAPAGGAVVWLIRYDPGAHETKVEKGDNKGRVVRQGDLVRQIAKLGLWRGDAKTFRLPKASAPGLKTVVLVQSARSGRILSARRL
jgi:hypothetical protein